MIKYIHIKTFIDLTKKLTNSELTTFIAIHFAQNSVRTFTEHNLQKILPFYTPRSVRNGLYSLQKHGYIVTHQKDRWHTAMPFVALKKATNNLMALDLAIIKKYKKQTVLFYKYKIFELLCNDILVKQRNLKSFLNISQYEIRQMEKHFEMNSYHRVLELKGLAKYQIGKDDLNVNLMPVIYTSLPNQYIFYNNTEKIKFKVDDKYIYRIRRLLLFRYIRDRENDIESNSKSDNGETNPDTITINTQLSIIYTKFIENTNKYRFKIEKQLTELFPYFIKRNEKKHAYLYECQSFI